ncbi:Retrovirus-related Pol polyprotein from transposon TNT 1-94 [Vitis vinifera]|uniref:Retrovirus-related Pol polyprotein from transposon TNT 1-94 n=1 Tax=Vitis vinifera TaxID=29760 RepID=A0A438CM62_VITVI|nr:Retrovirus-related Pol polyprotein from transposon TNT 1-94 [Vitis vinifera]
MTRKTMRNRGFEPWTFRSCLGYQHFVINDNNRDQRKKDSKKTLIATVAEIKIETNVAEKASALVATTDHGDRFHPLDLPHKKLFPQPMDIQTRQMIGCGIKRGKLYYLDLQTKDSNKLQQALMADGSEGEKKKMTWLCLMKTKDEVNLLFQKFHKMIETQYNAKVGVLRSDNGGEYQTKTPISYWGEAITSSAYLINRVPSSSINFQTPLQALTNAVVAPTVPNLPPRVFGCVTFVHLHKHQRTKLTSHALQCVFVGYALHKKGYQCYHPPTRQMYITMDVVFHEDSMYFSSESELQVNQEAGKLNMSGQQFGSEDVFTEIPNQSSSVEGVLNLEPDSFMKRLPHLHNRGKKPVGCRWIYTVKYKADGSIERFKARLVAKGYTQTYGIDYTETFAPVAKINTVRVLLSLAANLDWPLQQFDVKNVFLHGELSEEVYMDLPSECMVSEKQCQKVCKLKKSLYGLKQSPRAWFGTFTKSMRAFGYRQSNSDHTLFLKKQYGKITALIVYVDDMVVTGNDPEERKALQIIYLENSK